MNAQKWEAWLAKELSTPMCAQWAEDDLETTPVAEIRVLDEPANVALATFDWLVPDAGARERWRVG